MLIHSAEITGSVQFNNTDVSGITSVASFATTASVDAVVVKTGSFATTSSVNELQSKTGSYTSTSSFGTYTASNDLTNATQSTRLSTIESVTGSYTSTSSFGAYSSSINTFTSSAITRLNTIESVTGSYASTSSVNNLQSVTGSYASTGSNQFNGNQSISGSITSNGTITAQTLVVQTVTSSIEFVTGSTRNGSIAGNTHQFTGSVLMSGSLTGTSATFTGNATTPITSINDGGREWGLFRTSTNGGFMTFQSSGATLRGYLGNGGAISSAGETSFGIRSESDLILMSGGNNIRLTIASTGAATFSSTVTTGDILYVGAGGGGGGVWTWGATEAYIYSPTSKNLNLTTDGGLVKGLRITTSGAATFSNNVTMGAYILDQNGVGRKCFSGNIAGNQSVTVTLSCADQTSVKITCLFNHYGLINSYGCARMSFFAIGAGGGDVIDINNLATGNGGSWSFARISNTSFSITKNAGTYVGGGNYFIEVVGATLT